MKDAKDDTAVSFGGERRNLPRELGCCCLRFQVPYKAANFSVA
jgi:hypothetical protein